MFGFAVADGLTPVVGAAPYEVLARQVPRQLVQQLNCRADRGVRFLPFLGTNGGLREFLTVREPLPVATLASLHQRGKVDLLIDGALTQDRVTLRIHDGDSHALRAELELPFSAADPLAVVPRMWFEVTSVLGWTDKPSEVELPAGAALAWLLVAKDELLALEAGVPRRPEVDPMRPARECVALAPESAAVREVVLETVAHLLRGGHRSAAVVEVLGALGHRAPDDADCLRKVAGLLQACGDDATGAAVWTRVAGIAPTPEAVETAAALWFRTGHPDRAQSVLEAARSRGALEVGGLGQLAAVADRLQQFELRDEVTEELMGMGPLPVPVARLLITFLLEEDEAGKAREIAESALAVNPTAAPLWLDLGRACLMLDDREAARAALERCQGLELPNEDARRDVVRLLRMCTVPGLFRAMREVESALVAGDRRAALRLARTAVRRGPDAAEAWLFLGIVRHRLQHDRRAEVALRTALDLDDSLAEAHNRLGILLVARNDLEPGYEHLRRAEQLAPEDPSTQLHLAQACALRGHQGEGQRHLERARQLGANVKMLEAVQQQFFARGA